MPMGFLPANFRFDPLQLRRGVILAGVYAAIVAGAFYLAFEIRFDFIVPEQQQQDRLRLLPIAIGVKLVALIAARQLGSMMTYFSVPDLLRLFWAMLISSAVLLGPRLLGWPGYGAPRGVLLTDFMLSFGGLCAGRLALRMYRERLSGARRTGNGAHPQVQRIAIIGAGDVGATVAKEFLNAPWRGFLPVMFFDDDESKHGKLVHGVPVLGRPEEIARLKGVDTLAKAVIAMPSAAAKRMREIVDLMTAHGIRVETMPSMDELAAGRVKASRIRPVEVQDLLGREAVDLDSAGIRHALERRVVMVTGAGGSIGAELCRQIVAVNPQRLLMVEQAEGALFLVEQELNELGFAGAIVPIVADILDRPRIEQIFRRYQPQVVFHAAAHKHVFMMERQPAEAIYNNAVGTRQLAEIATAHGAEGFVLISTDKAINPTNVMGATKRLAELQLLSIAARCEQAPDRGANVENRGQRSEVKGQRSEVGDQRSEGREQRAEVRSQRVDDGFETVDHNDRVTTSLPTNSDLRPPTSDPQSLTPALPHPSAEARGPLSAVSGPSSTAVARTKLLAVRFGNVLGSSGSVIPIFKRQIAHGGPVTVTHPEVTRYFMTIPEAVGLVLQSFVLGKGGEIFVLDMGQPVKIVDLAKQMIELSGFRVGEDIEIVFTGLKPGEKLFEELQYRNEQYAPTAHPRIMQFRGSATYDPRVLRELERRLHELDSNQLKQELKRLVPEYTPHLE